MVQTMSLEIAGHEVLERVTENLRNVSLAEVPQDVAGFLREGFKKKKNWNFPIGGSPPPPPPIGKKKKKKLFVYFMFQSILKQHFFIFFPNWKMTPR